MFHLNSEVGEFTREMAGKPRLIPPPRDVLAAAYREVMEHQRLGDRFGVSASTARRWLIGAGVPIPPLTGRNRTAIPILNPDSHDIAWAAGVYEGEGSVANSRGVVTARISQKDRWLLERLQALFGGSVLTHHSSGGFIGGRRIIGHVDIWLLGGGRGRTFLLAIYPWLSPRRKTQIDKAIGRDLAA